MWRASLGGFEYLGSFMISSAVQIKIFRKRTPAVWVGGSFTATEQFSQCTMGREQGNGLRWKTSSLTIKEDMANVRTIPESMAAPPTHQVNILDPKQTQMNSILSICGNKITNTHNKTSCAIVARVVTRMTNTLVGRLLSSTVFLSL